MNQSQDAKRHEDDRQHRSEVAPLKVELERNRSVNHLPTDTVSEEQLKEVDSQTNELLDEQGPTSFRKETD